MPAKTYDPKKVVVDYAGILMTGVADGTFVRVERNEDTWSTKVGADGEVIRIKNNNRVGRVTVTLLQSSSANALLSAMAAADEASNAGQGSITVADTSGNSLHGGQNAWIVKPSAAEFAKDASTREWVFETEDLRTFSGGNL